MEEGFYWIKHYDLSSEWEIAQFTNNYWLLTGDEIQRDSTEFIEINENRIKSPDENII